jgi:hypothetical protein
MKYRGINFVKVIDNDEKQEDKMNETTKILSEFIP